MRKKGKEVLAAVGISVLLLFTLSNSEALVVISKDTATIGNTVILNADGVNDAANGTALQNTLAGITGSSTNRYVIRLGPGTYDVGNTTLAMKSFVDIEGSGQNVTVITGNPDGPATVTAFGVTDGEIRSLTVKNTGGGTAAVAIGTGGSIMITNVSAYASGSTSNHAIENHCPSPPCSNVLLKNVYTEVVSAGSSENIGILNTANSAVIMVDGIIYVSGTEGTTVGSNDNIGIKNVSNNSPIMMDMYVLAGGGANSYGIINDTSSGQMLNVYAFATDATGNNTGITNQNSSAPGMRNVRGEGSSGAQSTGMANINCGTASTSANSFTAIGHNASGMNIGILNDGCSFFLSSMFAAATPVKAGAAHYAVKNVNASPTIQSSVMRSPAPTTVSNCNGGCFGVHSTGSGTVKIDSSQVYTSLTSAVTVTETAGATTIFNGSGVTTYVGSSKLDGNTVSNAGTLKCIGVYNETYDALANITTPCTP